MSDKKNKLLGMSFGTACNRLRKQVLFKLLCDAELNTCYRCSKEIISVGDLSIEHKQAWMQADDPVAAFFDLDNIAFSHLSCNAAAGERPHKKYPDAHAQQRAKDKRRWRRMSIPERQAFRRQKYEKYGC